MWGTSVRHGSFVVTTPELYPVSLPWGVRVEAHWAFYLILMSMEEGVPPVAPPLQQPPPQLLPQPHGLLDPWEAVLHDLREDGQPQEHEVPRGVVHVAVGPAEATRLILGSWARVCNLGIAVAYHGTPCMCRSLHRPVCPAHWAHRL